MLESDNRVRYVYLGVIGVALTIVGITGLIYSSFPQGLRRGVNSAGGPGTFVELEIPRSLRVSDSGIVRINYMFATAPKSDSSGKIITETVYRNITITLRTASFDASPSPNEPIGKRVKNGLSYEWTWTIRPEKIGQHHIVLQFGGVPGPLLAEIASGLEVDHLPANAAIMDTSDWTYEQIVEQQEDSNYTYDLVVPIKVVNLFGLTALQAKIISSFTTFLGSGLTVTWLYEQWYKKRSQESKASSQETQT